MFFKESDMLDDMLLPSINPNEELEDISNNYFLPLFDVKKVEVRKESGRDKGIDFRMDVKAKGKITGFRFIVQLKATEEMEVNQDGTVTLTVYTTNINYLLNAGIPAYYVEYYRKENVCLYRDVHEFVKELSKKNPDWAKQQSHALRLSMKLDVAATDKMHERAIDHGKFSRTLTQKIILSSSMVPERATIDPDFNVHTDSEIRELVEKYGLSLINDSRWSVILELHKLGTQQIASTSKYNLVMGISSYYSGELVNALSYFKSALKLKEELSLDLLEHLLLFDATVRYALGIYSKEEYREKIKNLNKSDHIRHYVMIDRIKEEYAKGDDVDFDKRYERFVDQMNGILAAPDANENIKLLVRCEMVLYEGSKINLDFARDFSKTKVYEILMGSNQDLRRAMARNILHRKSIWAEKADQIRQEAIRDKNHFVFYHVLLNETKVGYEFEAYTDLVSDDDNPSRELRMAERENNLIAMLENLDHTIRYFKTVSYIENSCAALALQYQILHFKKDFEGANKTLAELSTIVEMYDLKELKNNLEALSGKGTTHENIARMKEQQAAESLKRQKEHDAMAAEMENWDRVDRERNLKVEDPDTIQIYPLSYFQFPKKSRSKVYEILNVSAGARETFDFMLDVEKIIPIANVYNNPILHEGNLDGEVSSSGLESFRRIFDIRRAFFENSFPLFEMMHPKI